jgi:hypothetical protein
VFSKGDEAGFPQVTMKRAKSDLGVKSIKRGNEWCWSMGQDEGYQGVQESQRIQEHIGGSADTLDTLDTLATDENPAKRFEEERTNNELERILPEKGNEAERSL